MRCKIIIVFLFLWLSAGFGKNLDGRYGFGYSYHNFNNTQALSLRYHVSQYLHSTFILGFNTDNNLGVTVLGVKICRNSHLEENMNYYIGVAGYVAADKVGQPVVSTGFEFDGVLGGEFFFQGLPNLGFQFEVGIAIRSVRQISTNSFGGPFTQAGIHYYF